MRSEGQGQFTERVRGLKPYGYTRGNERLHLGGGGHGLKLASALGVHGGGNNRPGWGWRLRLSSALLVVAADTFCLPWASSPGKIPSYPMNASPIPDQENTLNQAQSDALSLALSYLSIVELRDFLRRLKELPPERPPAPRF